MSLLATLNCIVKISCPAKHQKMQGTDNCNITVSLGTKWCRLCMLLNAFQCLGKLRRDHEEDAKALNHHQHQQNGQKITPAALVKLLSEVQVQMH